MQIKEKPLSFYKEIKILLNIEFRNEWRMKTGVLGIVLHIVTAIFICYLSFERIPDIATNPLFWLIILFTTINGISKGFMEEKRGLKVYLQQMVRPESILISKMIYHSLLMVVLSMATLGFYTFFIGIEPLSFSNYIVSILLSVIGLSIIFTMVSAIAANASKPGMLVPIMSLPLVLPIILIGLKATDRAMKLETSTSIYKDWVLLAFLDILIALLAIVLFKFVRKE